MKIAVLDDYQDCVRNLECFALLKDHEVKIFNHGARGVGQLAIRLAPFDALVLIRERSTLSRALLQRLPNLKLISQTGRAGKHIDLQAAAERGIAVAEGVGDPTAPAELTWALILAASRKLVQYASHLKQGIWQTASLDPQFNRLGRSLKGRTLGIWGYGRIGRLVASYGKAFGMRVLIWGSESSRAQAALDGFEAAQSKDGLFAQSDVLSLHLRLSETTRGMVRRSDLALMKPDALLVNTSRAELIEPDALDAALQSGRPGWAALDVFDSEPPARESTLLRLPNVLATPHIGYVEQDSYELYFRAAFENVIAFASGAPTNLLVPEQPAPQPVSTTLSPP
ncbi:D-2-hydroxyacid dehydrogenase family protein [Oxalobacteraceae bacterium R-40]|uniref:D-2-hydroxyacid dehydrogenase family protein n=1 Tax=Keguizhuia sedimenti TaxID=3064264 RepID=A0ABU1BKM7_9BURK|nr:D-2-hydroxyacid dehydrogenase family protein [Oxalobacteraceae bacterium R-40]